MQEVMDMLATNLQSWATVTHKGQVTIPKQIKFT